MLNFRAYHDGLSVGESFSAMIENNHINSMDGSLSAGRTLRGKLSYELPINWEELEIRVDLTSLSFSTQGEFTITLQNQ